jgi:hypothetical protein
MKCNYPAKVQGHDGNGKKFIEEGSVVNLNRSGILVLLNRAILDCYEVSVRIALPTEFLEFGTSKLATRGTMVRCEPRPNGVPGVAIKFQHYRILRCCIKAANDEQSSD